MQLASWLRVPHLRYNTREMDRVYGFRDVHR